MQIFHPALLRGYDRLASSLPSRRALLIGSLLLGTGALAATGLGHLLLDAFHSLPRRAVTGALMPPALNLDSERRLLLRRVADKCVYRHGYKLTLSRQELATVLADYIH
jgi:hypothetical protein